jgi:hypothetical protein
MPNTRQDRALVSAKELTESEMKYIAYKVFRCSISDVREAAEIAGRSRKEVYKELEGMGRRKCKTYYLFFKEGGSIFVTSSLAEYFGKPNLSQLQGHFIGKETTRPLTDDIAKGAVFISDTGKHVEAVTEPALHG